MGVALTKQRLRRVCAEVFDTLLYCYAIQLKREKEALVELEDRRSNSALPNRDRDCPKNESIAENMAIMGLASQSQQWVVRS